MRRVACTVGLAVALGGCQESHSLVLIGGTLSNPGVPPIVDSIVVITGGKIRAAGARREVPVPQDSERVDVSGNVLLPIVGGTILPGRPASLEVHQGSESGPVIRRLKGGKWLP